MGKVSQEQRVAARLDETESMQTRALSHGFWWRSRVGLGVVFRWVHHGEVGLRSGWKFTPQVRSESVGYTSRHRHSCNQTQARTRGKGLSWNAAPEWRGYLLLGEPFHSSDYHCYSLCFFCNSNISSMRQGDQDCKEDSSWFLLKHNDVFHFFLCSCLILPNSLLTVTEH